MVGHLLSRRGNLKGAEAAVDRANAILPRLTEAFGWLMIETRILLAPALAPSVAAPKPLHISTRRVRCSPGIVTPGNYPTGTKEIARQLRVASRRPHPSHELTDAERRIPRLLATDLTLREIGRKLYLSLNTVKTHVHSIIAS